MSEDPNKNNTVKSSFDFKELMNLGENPQLQNQLQSMMQQQFTNHLPNQQQNDSNKEQLSKEEMRAKLRAKIREKEDMRRGKQYNEQKQIDQLKKNPMVNAMSDSKNVDINMLVDQIMRQQNIPNNPQQRKSVKRQVEQMLEKMNTR